MSQTKEKYVPGSLIKLYKSQVAFNDAISSLRNLRDNQKEYLSEYSYSQIHTLIRIFEITIKEKIK